MSILESSYVAGILILILLCFRKLWQNRVKHKYYLLLWVLILVKLLIPITIPVDINIFHNSVHQEMNKKVVQMIHKQDVPALESDRNLQINDKNIKDLDQDKLRIIWALGLVCSLLYFGLGYYSSAKKVHKCFAMENAIIDQWLQKEGMKQVKVYSSKVLATPIVCGIFSNKLIIPDGMDLSDARKLDYILSHEIIHIRRKDN